jgi:anti-sigma regulatory factor (Ser/Thr protein kinase)
LLDVSRITLGKASLHFEPVELSALVREAMRTAQQSGKLAHHEVETDLVPAWVNGDRARLEQVVVNLLDNAIKFTPAGKRILLSVREGDGVATLAVADAGIGIPANDLTRVFELFIQGPQDMSRTRGGMGVGLAIVKRLVELHGGQVTAASAGPGAGSAFTVTLASVLPPAATPPPERGEPTSHRSLDVLVVEDNADARDFAHCAARAQGSQREGRRHRPGRARVVRAGEAGRRVRRHRASRSRWLCDRSPCAGAPGMTSVVLVALTGYGQPHDEAQAFSAGFDLHVTKPIAVDHLDRLLSECRGRPVRVNPLSLS